VLFVDDNTTAALTLVTVELDLLNDRHAFDDTDGLVIPNDEVLDADVGYCKSRTLWLAKSGRSASDKKFSERLKKIRHCPFRPAA